MSRIRHSALPKLAQCPRFEGSPGTSPEAARGTSMDEAFRLSLAGDHTFAQALPGEDLPAVQWAIAKVMELAEGQPYETREEYLRMHTPGIAHVGTADVLCTAGAWVGDLKTGQMRSYYEQMASYALACMDREFCDVWTAHVLYADARQVASYRFTWDEAKRVVDRIIAEVNDPNSKPRGCDYCGWCKHKDRCSARIDDMTGALAVVYDQQALGITQMREYLLCDPDRLSRFLRQWKLVEKEVAEPVIEAAKAKLESEPDSIPGWKLTSVSGREYFDNAAIVRAAEAGKCGLNELVLALGGKMGGKKFREWAASLGVEVDDSAAQTGGPSVQLRQVASKKK